MGVDAVKVHGKDEEICNLLENAITSLVENNGGKELKRLLFSIRFPEACPVLLDHMNGVHHIVEKLDEKSRLLMGHFYSRRTSGRSGRINSCNWF